MEKQHPHFRYWNTTLHLENLFLQFMQSQREGNFKLYFDMLWQIVPWMFSMDHFHYERWLSVHIRDLVQLENECPVVKDKLEKGHFVTQKTCRRFSMMAHDHVHEQFNAVLKGDGGVIGIIENDSALRRWMIAGPELARILNDIKNCTSPTIICSDRHHEQIVSTIKEVCNKCSKCDRSF